VVLRTAASSRTPREGLFRTQYTELSTQHSALLLPAPSSRNPQGRLSCRANSREPRADSRQRKRMLVARGGACDERWEVDGPRLASVAQGPSGQEGLRFRHRIGDEKNVRRVPPYIMFSVVGPRIPVPQVLRAAAQPIPGLCSSANRSSSLTRVHRCPASKPRMHCRGASVPGISNAAIRAASSHALLVIRDRARFLCAFNGSAAIMCIEQRCLRPWLNCAAVWLTHPIMPAPLRTAPYHCRTAPIGLDVPVSPVAACRWHAGRSPAVWRSGAAGAVATAPDRALPCGDACR